MKKLFSLSIVCLALIFSLSVNALADEYFSRTEVQVHMDNYRDTYFYEASIATITTEHFTEWQYGDVFLFLDIEGKDEYSTEAGLFYYEIAPRFSLNKMFDVDLSTPFTGDIYFAGQFNDGTIVGKSDDGINRAWLYGLSIDFKFQPNYGFSNLSVYVRDERTQDTSYQVTFAWGQPFQVGELNLAFNGFMDIWKDNEKTVIITEPQLRLNLSSFFEKDNFLSNCSIGTELEISRDFFKKGAGWIINPTGFFALSL
jgi:nucleoside-specific outer membrane channel protein Tsx